LLPNQFPFQVKTTNDGIQSRIQGSDISTHVNGSGRVRTDTGGSIIQSRDTSNPVTRKSPAVTRKSHDLYIGIGFTDLRYANGPEISEVIQASVDSQVIAADSAVEGPLPYSFSLRAQARHVEIP
jgi:hypothetical protein